MIKKKKIHAKNETLKITFDAVCPIHVGDCNETAGIEAMFPLVLSYDVGTNLTKKYKKIQANVQVVLILDDLLKYFNNVLKSIFTF